MIALDTNVLIYACDRSNPADSRPHNRKNAHGEDDPAGFGCGSCPALLPGVVRRSSDLKAATFSYDTELDRFLDRLICDGRFLDSVSEDPRGVANALGLTLSDEAEAQFRQMTLAEHLARFELARKIPSCWSISPTTRTRRWARGTG